MTDLNTMLAHRRKAPVNLSYNILASDPSMFGFVEYYSNQ